MLQRLGVITEMDNGILTAYCEAYERWHGAYLEFIENGRQYVVYNDKGNVSKNPLITVIENSSRDMVRYLTEMGMTPSARSRIKVDFGANEAEKDPLGLGIGKK